MVHVMEDVFRADCIAGFGVEDDYRLQLFLVGVPEPETYTYDTVEEMEQAREAAIKEWEQELK